MRRPVLLLTLGALLLAGCVSAPERAVPTLAPAATPSPLPAAPVVGDGPLDPALRAELDEFVSDPVFFARGSAARIAAFGDVRVAWVLVDALRFQRAGLVHDELVAALTALTGIDPGTSPHADWVVFSDALLRWDVAAPPGYLADKRAVHLGTEPDWAPFFDDEAALDWRQVAWGGVLRGAIEALDDPPVVPATRAEDLADTDVVFGIVVGNEARAYPRRYLEVHELVNDEVGGVPVVLPYCTLCGAALAFDPVVDGVRLRLGTSGLLVRSNKLAYDDATESLWHQFEGRAVTGPLRGTELARIDVTTTDWLTWRSTHPDTTVLARPGPSDRYDGSFLATRTGDPIFPVGAVDDRLAAATVVLGVTAPNGVAVAFPRSQVDALLARGDEVVAGGVRLRRDGPGVRADGVDGGPRLHITEAFWFAWSQFRPGTEVWRAPTA